MLFSTFGRRFVAYLNFADLKFAHGFGLNVEEEFLSRGYRCHHLLFILQLFQWVLLIVPRLKRWRIFVLFIFLRSHDLEVRFKLLLVWLMRFLHCRHVSPVYDISCKVLSPLTTSTMEAARRLHRFYVSLSTGSTFRVRPMVSKMNCATLIILLVGLSLIAGTSFLKLATLMWHKLFVLIIFDDSLCLGTLSRILNAVSLRDRYLVIVDKSPEMARNFILFEGLL